MKNTDIKIGDKVRFLNDVGGGIVTRVEEDIIYVEDEIGFEVPMPVNEVVVVERSQEKPDSKDEVEAAGGMASETLRETDTETSDEGFIEEHHDDNNPRIYLAFLDAAGPRAKSPDVNLHIINDSNYFCLFLVVEMGQDGLARELFNGRLVPNTKEYLNKFSTSDLDVNWHVQIILYRKDKPFRLFEPTSELIKIKANRFFRDNSFKTNDFFDDKAVLIPVIKMIWNGRWRI